MLSDARIYPDIETSVYDGDTIDFLCRTWIGSWQFESTRVYGVDTSEITSSEKQERERAQLHRDFVVDWIKKGQERYSSNEETKLGTFPFEVEPVVYDSFGRVVGRVFRKSDGADLSKSLLDEFDGIKYSE
jgi:endonuclease YncB( thermonuclease family)